MTEETAFTIPADGDSGGGGHGSSGDCSLYGTPNFTEVTYPERGKSAGLLLALIVVPNILVILCTIWSLYRSRSKVSIPKLIILTLAVDDLFNGLVSIMTQMFRYMYGFCATGGKASCITQTFFDNILLQMSVLLVMVMSTERFCAVKFPFRYDTYFSVLGTFKFIGALFVYTTFISLLPVMGVGKYEYGQFGCDFQWADETTLGRGYVYFRGLMVMIYLGIILVLNVVSCYAVYVMQFKVAPVKSKEGGPPTDNKDQALQRRFMILVVFTSLTSIICNMPYPIRLFQIQMAVENPSVPTFVIKRIFMSNSIVNPVLMLMFYASLIIKCPPWKSEDQPEKSTTNA